jgi:uncharacterized protein
MNIALIGASGFVGAALLLELISRQHRVTALVRRKERVEAQPLVTLHALDVNDEAAVVSAFNPGWDDPNLYDTFMRGHGAIVRAVEASGVKRFLVVGGAGSLFVAPGVQLVDTKDFLSHVPANILPGARAARDALTALRENTTLDWTFVSPPAMLAPGARTGRYRLGTEALLMNGDAPSGISVPDLAVAIVDELETPRFVRARFTAASETAS